MVDFSLFKQLTVLYAEDEECIRTAVTKTFQKIFKKCFVANDGLEALRLYEDLKVRSERVDIVVCDINMPHLNGIELVEQIKKIDPKIEVVMVTARTDAQALVEAISLGVSHYEIKPVNLSNLLNNMSEIAKKYINEKIIQNQHIEMMQYLDILDKVAIVSKTDTNGMISFVNEIFCEVSGFSQAELIGKSHNLIRHPDTPKEVFSKMWEMLNSNKPWKGKLKNRAKTGEPYYVYAYIFPLFDNITLDKIGYIGIRFLITEEENARLDFKRKVVESISSQKKREYELSKKVDFYEKELKQLEFLENFKDSLEKERLKNQKILAQLSGAEEENKNMREKHNEKIRELNETTQKMNAEVSQLRVKYDASKASNQALKEENQKKESVIASLENELVKQAKIIRDLKDVIEHREDQLTLIKEGTK